MIELLSDAGYVQKSDPSIQVGLHLLHNTKKQFERLQSNKGHVRGRGTDDQRTLLHNTLMSMVQTPSPVCNETQGQKSRRIQKKNIPSLRQIIKAVGLPYTSGVRIIEPAAKRRLLLKTGGKDLIWSALPQRRKYSKVSEEVKDGLKKWIINHPSVTESPLMNDTLIIKDKEKRR